METFVFKFNGHPPSVNMCFGNPRGRGRRFKMPEYTEWERHVERSIAVRNKDNDFRAVDGAPYTLEILVYSERWVQKNLMGLRKPDADNFIKPTQDAICKITGWKDQNALTITVSKVEAPGPDFTLVTFKFISQWWASEQ